MFFRKIKNFLGVLFYGKEVVYYRNKVRKLCEENKIELRQIENMDVNKSKLILYKSGRFGLKIPTITNRSHYITAMHEIGHAIGPWQDKNENTILEMEAGAWKWARENVPDWCEKDGHFRRECLDTYFKYVDFATKAGHKHICLGGPLIVNLFPMPAENHIIWKMMRDDMA